MENMIGELRSAIARKGPIWHLISKNHDLLMYAQSLRSDWVNRKIIEWLAYKGVLDLIQRPPKGKVWSHYSDDYLNQIGEMWEDDISTVMSIIDHELSQYAITHITLEGTREFLVSDHDIIITSGGFCFLWPGE